MPVIGLLPRARGSAGFKLSATQTSITGTGGVTTGLSTIAAGGAVATVANSPTVTPWNVAAITSIVAGVVNVVVLALASTPTIAAAGGAILVNVIAVGT
jgi:hypothetical protein